MRLPISPRLTKPSSEDGTYHNRSSNNKSRVNTIRLSYEKNNHQPLSGRRLSGGGGGSRSSGSIVGANFSKAEKGNRRFVPNVNSPTWRSIQGIVKSKISSPRHYASSPRHNAKYKMGSPSPRGNIGGFFGVTNHNKVSSSQQQGVSSSAMNFGTSVGVVDSYSLTAASTNSIDDLEMKISGSSLDSEKEGGRYCNEEVAEDFKVDGRDEQEVVVGRVENNKIFSKDDGEVRDVSLVEMRSAAGQSKEEVSVCGSTPLSNVWLNSPLPLTLLLSILLSSIINF